MMLSKLRRRIVCMLMAVFLALIVSVIACTSVISARQSVERQKEILRGAALQPMTRRTSDARSAEYRSGTPFFAVRLDPGGGVVSVYRFSFDITDGEAARAAQRALHSGRTSGVLRDQQLRFLTRTDAEGYARVTCISMAEYEEAQNKQLLYSLLLVPVLLLLLLVLVALPLSKWLISPAQRAWDAQKRFIADASHELKTPLTVILANLSILLKDRERTIADCGGWIESTREEAQQMRKLVEDMLTLARAEDEQSAVAFARVDLSELLEHALMTIEPVAYDRGVALDTDVQQGVVAVCSQTHIRQLMMILLDNAIKYAGGEKHVSVSLRKRRERIELRVVNTGEPIPAEVLGHLFDRFYRGDANRTSEGFGLGLAIAKRIVQMHKGTIRADSDAASGTTLSVVLRAK